MATEKQIAANRRNARLSTGPRTPEGKAVSRFNARKHGLAARELLLPGESDTEFTALWQGCRAHFQPKSLEDEHLVLDLAAAEWGFRRIIRIETALPLETYTAGMLKLARYEIKLRRRFYDALGELNAASRRPANEN
jgi:hypothetical protein